MSLTTEQFGMQLDWEERLGPTTPGVAKRRRGTPIRRVRQLSLLRRDLVGGAICVLAGFCAVAVVMENWVFAVTAAAVLLTEVLYAFGVAGPRSMLSLLPVARRTATAVGVVATTLAVVDHSAVVPALVLASAAVLAALAVMRLAARHPRLRDRYGLGEPSRLLVGDPDALRGTSPLSLEISEGVDGNGRVVGILRSDPHTGAGAYAPREDGPAPKGATVPAQRVDPPPFTGSLVDVIVEAVVSADVDEVCIVPGGALGPQEIRELSWAMEHTGIELMVGTHLEAVSPNRLEAVRHGGRILLRLSSGRPRGTAALIRALMDRLLSALLLLLLSPVWLLIALAVRVDTPGPVLYRQTRVGEGGRTFRMYKFRSMHRDADQRLRELETLNMHGSDGCLFKVRDDPRVTRTGKFLRRSSLDELPQLFNVLRGEMSLIGPRPALPSEVERYDRVARRRLAAKPGMTGLWQVSGRARLSWQESLYFDLEYVDNWSPALDGCIAVRTVGAVLRSDGAF